MEHLSKMMKESNESVVSSFANIVKDLATAFMPMPTPNYHYSYPNLHPLHTTQPTFATPTLPQTTMPQPVSSQATMPQTTRPHSAPPQPATTQEGSSNEPVYEALRTAYNIDDLE